MRRGGGGAHWYGGARHLAIDQSSTLASHTQRLISFIKAKVSSDLPRFTAIASLTARVNVKRQHSLPDFYFITVFKDVRIAFSFWLDEKFLMKEKYKIVTWLHYVYGRETFRKGDPCTLPQLHGHTDPAKDSQDHDSSTGRACTYHEPNSAPPTIPYSIPEKLLLILSYQSLPVHSRLQSISKTHNQRNVLC